MYYGAIKHCDIANGVGVRTSLFVSGCTHHCPGCFQPETWDFSYGEEFDEAAEKEILKSLEPDYIDGLTVLGGEPMEPANQRVLKEVVAKVKQQFPSKNIWLYTGDVYEDIKDENNPRHTEVTNELLDMIDVLVDGRFMEEFKDITLKFRGSSNQRILNLKATRQTGALVFWEDDETFSKRGSW